MIYPGYEGQCFAPHFDIGHEKSFLERSVLSVVVYLNDDFEGGGTRFEDVTVKPKAGSAVVFAQDLRHEGLRVKSGVKRVMRTDVMGRF